MWGFDHLDFKSQIIIGGTRPVLRFQDFSTHSPSKNIFMSRIPVGGTRSVLRFTDFSTDPLKTKPEKMNWIKSRNDH